MYNTVLTIGTRHIEEGKTNIHNEMIMMIMLILIIAIYLHAD
jgi:hypothetical protein